MNNNEYVICLIAPDKTANYWSLRGFSPWLTAANYYKSEKSANQIVNKMLNPSTDYSKKLPKNWQEKGYSVRIFHKNQAKDPTTADLGERTISARFFCLEYASKALLLAERKHDARFRLMAAELSNLVKLLPSRPDLLEGIEKAFQARHLDLPIEERSQEWLIFREIEIATKKRSLTGDR